MLIVDLYVEQGSTFHRNINLGTDITGYSVSCNIVDSVGSTTLNVVSIDNAANGDIDLDITDLQTSAMSTGVAKYDIELTSNLGVVSKPVKGRIYVDGETTI